MENKKNSKALIIIALVFVLLMAGAYVLYNQLSGSVENNNLVAQGGSSASSAASDETTKSENPSTDVSGSSEKSDDNQKAPSEGTTGSGSTADTASTQGTADSQDTTDSSDSTEQQLSMAPDFTVYDGDGNPVSLSDFIGKPVIVKFWASWCGPCKSEMPDFEEVYTKYGDDIHFLMINSTDGSRETVETAKAFIAEQGYTFPVYFDTDYDASTTYGVSGIPMTFFIDAEGHAVAYGQGMLDRDTLQVGIDMIYMP